MISFAHVIISFASAYVLIWAGAGIFTTICTFNSKDYDNG